MEKETLKQYEDMRRECDDLKVRIKNAERELADFENRFCIKDITFGGTGGIQHFTVEGIRYPEYTQKKTQLMQRKLRMETLKKELESKITEVEQYIDSIDDSRKRLIMRYKYIDGLSWVQIAGKMGTAESSVRSEIKRYMDEKN
jgi:DNA-directed RNA polymerase specialized sigma24 family protein